MENSITKEPSLEEAMAIQDEIRSALTELKKVREQMQHDQKFIDASGKRTDSKLTEVRAQLVKLRAS